MSDYDVPISIAAREIGVTPTALKRWEREGLPIVIRKSAAGRRVFSQEDIEVLRRFAVTKMVARRAALRARHK
jgi:DNA-binding transcriptional MerR regulator